MIHAHPLGSRLQKAGLVGILATLLATGGLLAADLMSVDDGASVVFRITTTGNVGVGTGPTPHTLLELNGPLATAFSTKTSSYTVTEGDSVIACDASSGPLTLTLPTAVGIPGRVYTFKKTDASANAVIVSGDAAETIDGGLTQVLPTCFAFVTVVSDGANWLVTSSGNNTLGVSWDVDDDLTTDNGWVAVGDGSYGYNAANGNVEFSGVRNETNGIAIDVQNPAWLGAGVNLSDGAWLVDFELRPTGLSYGGDTIVYVGFSNLDQGTLSNGSQDYVGVSLRNLGSTDDGLHDASVDDGTPQSTTPVDFLFTQTTYFCRMRRTSLTTGDFEMFSDSARTVSVFSLPLTLDANMIDLRFMKLMSYHTDSSGGSLVGTIDRIRIANSTTTPPQ